MSEIQRDKINRSDVGDDTILQSSCSVMVMTSTLSKRVFFREADWKEGAADRGSYRKVILDRSDWEEMGRPEEITVTIEPGDKLNAQAR